MFRKKYLFLLSTLFIINIGAQNYSDLKIMEYIFRDEMAFKSSFQDVSPKLFSLLDHTYSTIDYNIIWKNNLKTDNLKMWLSKSAKVGFETSHLLSRLNNVQTEKNSRISKVHNDIEYTLIYLELYSKLYNGNIKIGERGKNFHLPFQNIDTSMVLLSIASSNDFSPFYNCLPNKKDFFNLVNKGIQLYDLKENEKWDKIILNTDSLQLGDRSETVVLVKERLNKLGYYQSYHKLRSPIFDINLENSIKLYQNSFRLDTTGVVKESTIESINQPLEDLWKKVALNIERWLWYPKDFGSYHVLINLPAFTFRLYENDSLLNMQKVVIGRKDRETPIFYSTMSYLDLNPTWTVPPTILSKDVVPAAKKSSSYLAKKSIKVIDYSTGKVVNYNDINWSKYKAYGFVQDPGPSNSLGNVKFVFPNPYFIFFHDTPTKSHFALNDRAYSSGCIRLENAQGLAEIILKEYPEYTSEKIDEVIKTRKTTRITLKNQPQVFIGYFTVDVDDNGVANFYNDIYGHDKILTPKLSL